MKRKKTRNKRKPSLKETVDKLTAIAEDHLSKLPEEDRDERVAAFSRLLIRPCDDIHATPSRNGDTRPSRVAARERG
jgi:hypothetical protein